MAPGYQRQDLVHLSADGWHAVLGHDWDAPARQCVTHWAAHGLPLVVTRQMDRTGDASPGDWLALGLPAPACWGRRRIALQVRSRDVAGTRSFPPVSAIHDLLAPEAAARCLHLHTCLTEQGLPEQVYGSHGWQWLTGLGYLHPDSDLDLLVRVPDANGADAAAAGLASCGVEHPRIDGELLFADGSATAWREWQRWRRGDVDGILVKRRSGATLERDDAWLRSDAAQEHTHAR